MGRKECEVTVPEALKILRLRLRENQYGRFHDSAREEVLARTIALERGLCGQCEMTILKLRQVVGGRKGITLVCKAGEHPLNRYRPLVYDPIAEIPPCKSFTPIQKERTATGS